MRHDFEGLVSVWRVFCCRPLFSHQTLRYLFPNETRRTQLVRGLDMTRLSAFLAVLLCAGIVGSNAEAQHKRKDAPRTEEIPAIIEACLTPDTTPTARIEACTEMLSEPSLNKEGQITALTFRATAYMDTYDYTSAVADFSQGLELAPSNIGMLHGRAQALGEMGEYSHALQDYDRAIQIAPQEPLLLTGRGIIYIQLGDMDAAERDMKAALAIDSNHVDTLAALGSLYIERGEYEAALTPLNRAIELRADLGRLYLRRGLAQLLLNHTDMAVEDLSIALDVSGREPYTLMLRAMAYVDMDHDDAAVTDFTEALQADPTLVGAWEGRGQIFMARNEYEAARSDLDIASQIAPSANNLNSIAWLLVSAEDKSFRDPEAALDYVSRSLELDENADNVDTAAAVYVLLGDVDEATRYYVRSMELGGEARVTIYQEYLKERGFYASAVDGVDGPNTREAIRSFAESGRVLLVD